MVHILRRVLLQATGIAGCLGQREESLDFVTVAYVPSYPNMQHYVMTQKNYYECVAADVTVERFSSGSSVVKAFASGDIDVALFGITPAMNFVDKATDASILAANSRSGSKIMRNELGDLDKQRLRARWLGMQGRLDM